MSKHNSHERRTMIAWAFRNLHHKGVVWSVRYKGLTIMHTPHVILKNCTFPVWKGGQAQVRKTGNKSVHAFVKGELLVDPIEISKVLEKLQKTTNSAYYNPFKTDTFVDSNNQEVSKADYVLLSGMDDKPKVTFLRSET